MNYLRLHTRLPFVKSYVFLDTTDHLFCRVFDRASIHLMGMKEFFSHDSRIRLIKCYVKAGDSALFEEKLPEIRNAALIMGYSEYDEYCDKLASLAC